MKSVVLSAQQHLLILCVVRGRHTYTHVRTHVLASILKKERLFERTTKETSLSHLERARVLTYSLFLYFNQ